MKPNNVTIKKWDEAIIKMHSYLEELLSKSPQLLDELDNIPEKGIYVFFEEGEPIYTGRTNNMRSRLRMHCRPSAGHESATFAFLLAKESAAQEGIDVSRRRKQLQIDPSFTRLYDKAKARVSMMPVSYVEIDDPIEQTLFEVYASITLNTVKYNKFDNH